MEKTDPIIHTKLHPPFLRHKLVPRPRLQEQIRRGLRGPLTLVAAPAGFGKTTLVASCIANCGMPFAWLSLDKNDNQSSRFLTYLIAALQVVNDCIGHEAAQHLGLGQQPSPEIVMTNLINDIDCAGSEFALVLDDYQLISSQAAHEVVEFLLEYCPSTFHVVIATRADPPFPLSRMRVRGRVLELRAADLRFSELEAGQFLNEVMHLRLDSGSIKALKERTEGWIAGLQMAALSIQSREDISSFIEGFSGTNRYILDYLLEEVLTNQPSEIHNFLLYTSILDRMTAPLCDALTGGTGSQNILVGLEKANLFVSCLDDERTWYRYHHLFAELLKVRLQQVQEGILHDLHIRSATWFEQNGFVGDAIQHFLAAGEDHQAADLIERYGAGYWAQNDPSIFQMADNLPKEILIAHPKIGLHQACLLIIQGNMQQVSPLLDDLARSPVTVKPDSEFRWMQTIILLVRAFLASLASTSKLDPLPDYEMLMEIPNDEPILRDAADILYGMTLRRRGEIDLAAEVSEKSIQRMKKADEMLAVPTLVPFLARVYLMQGRLKAAASLCREYLIPGREKDTRFITSAGTMNVTLGEVLFEWNRVDEGEKLIREGLEANKPWQNIMTDGFGLSALARILGSKGDCSGAMQIVEQLEEKLRGHPRPREFNADFYTLRARILLTSGKLREASRWAEQVFLSENYHLQPELYRLTLARICLAQGRVDEIEGILSGEESQLAYGNRKARQLEGDLLRAAALVGQGRLAQAYQLIETCLSMGEPEGYIQTFVDVGEPARDLLSAYLRSDTPAHEIYARKVLHAFPLTPVIQSAVTQAGGLIESLSERELEVLQLMSFGKTNQQIAHQLVVATGTVKAHTSNIYRKLDVTNRTEAVARARQLSIIP